MGFNASSLVLDVEQGLQQITQTTIKLLSAAESGGVEPPYHGYTHLQPINFL